MEWKRTVLVFAFVLVAFVALVAAQVRIPMPDPGVLDPTATRILDCDGVQIEVRFYDYNPISDTHWKSLGFGLPRERNYVQGTAETAGEAMKWYIDANRDGWADEVVTFEELRQRANGSWCRVYELYRKGR